MADSQFLSSRIRSKADEIIREQGRPLQPSEIESIIREQDSELWEKISSKCSDYIRIILSLSKEPPFIKYVSAVSIKGIDKRSLFFGCEGVTYPSSKWELCGQKTKHQKKKLSAHKKHFVKESTHHNSTSHQVTPARPITHTVTSKVVQKVKADPTTLVRKEIDSETAGDSWNNLSNNVPMTDPMWGQITSAIYEIGRYIQKNGSGSELYTTLLPKYPILCQAKEYEQDIENILIREILIREELQHSLYA